MSALKFYPVFLDNIAPSVQASDLRALFSRVGLVIDVIIVEEEELEEKLVMLVVVTVAVVDEGEG